MEPTWADFVDSLFWAMIGFGLGVFVKVNPHDPGDRFKLKYNLSRYAKYGGYISGTAMLIYALRELFHLVRS